MKMSEINFVQRDTWKSSALTTGMTSIQRAYKEYFLYLTAPLDDLLGHPTGLRYSFVNGRLYFAPADDGFGIHQQRANARCAYIPRRVFGDLKPEQVSGRYYYKFDEECGLYYLEVLE